MHEKKYVEDIVSYPVRPIVPRQEGKSDMEFLREEELVNGLHVSSRSYKPVTCYQISPKGKVRQD